MVNNQATGDRFQKSSKLVVSESLSDFALYVTCILCQFF